MKMQNVGLLTSTIARNLTLENGVRYFATVTGMYNVVVILYFDDI